MTRREMEDLEEIAYFQNWTANKKLRRQKRIDFIKKLLRIKK